MAFGKQLRNRIVGLLVILSLILIVIPALMSPEKIKADKHENAIAINQNGAVVDNKGQLVAVGANENTVPAPVDYTAQLEGDLNDFQAPVPDALPIADNQGPFENRVNQNTNVNNSVSNNTQPQAFEPQVQNQNTLESATPIIQRRTTQTTVQTPQPKEETLVSSRKSNSQPKTEILSSNRSNTTKQQPKASTSSYYTAQVGAFSQQAKVNTLVSKLRANGFNPSTAKVMVNGKNLIKVFAGTAKTKDAAQSMCNKVKALKINSDCRVNNP